MSVEDELREAAVSWYKTISDKDFPATIDALADDGDWFDYAPHRYDGKASYRDFFYKVMEPVDEVNTSLHDIHVRVLSETLGVVTGFDDLTATRKDGKPDIKTSGRSTMVFSKIGDEWKMVHGHFTMMKP